MSRNMNEASTEALYNAIEIEPHPEPSDELLGSINSDSANDKIKEQEKLRQKLRFFYMNPIEKWQYKQRFPYKFFVQVIKIVVVTLQSCLFAHHRSLYVDFVSNNKVSFSHLFLKGWDSSREIISYPPQSGDLAVYLTSDFYSAMDYAVINYANLENAIGSYSYTDENNQSKSMEFCLYRYKKCDIFGFNESYAFNSDIITKCISINLPKPGENGFSSLKFFRQKGFEIQFSALVRAELNFGVKTINLKPAGPKASPECFQYNLSVNFDNTAHNGKVKLSLKDVVYKLHCKGTIYDNDTDLESLLHSLLNSVVIVFCFISFILCCRAVYKGNQLRKVTVVFFKNNYNKVIPFKDQLEFINLWYITMMTSDFIVVVGSILKERIEVNDFSGDDWNICSIMLGTGVFLIWFCVLRYLGFFRTYNVVILTIKVAAPMIVRFLVCTILIYAGFVFCGWLVLGPYHSKFRTLSVTSECLFALINGDDVFETFSTLEPTRSLFIWWFCRIYLYMFISMFIYVILSLFVSVILDAYETIKRYYAEGFPKNEIQDFIDGGLRYPNLSDSSSSLADDCSRLWPGNTSGKIFNAVCCCASIRENRNEFVSDS